MAGLEGRGRTQPCLCLLPSSPAASGDRAGTSGIIVGPAAQAPGPLPAGHPEPLSEFLQSDLFIFLNITFEMFFLAFLGVLLCW